jgi:hypothetical protein
MLVVGQVLILALLLLAAVIDIADRSTSPAGEVRHLPDALSVAVLWRRCEGRWPTASGMAALQSWLLATRGRFRRRPVAG